MTQEKTYNISFSTPSGIFVELRRLPARDVEAAREEYGHLPSFVCKEVPEIDVQAQSRQMAERDYTHAVAEHCDL